MTEDDDTAVAFFRLLVQQRPQPIHLLHAQFSFGAVQTDKQVEFLFAVTGVKPINGRLEIIAIDRPLLEVYIVVSWCNKQGIGDGLTGKMQDAVGAREVLLRIDHIA